LSAPGDRRDEDIAEIGAVAASAMFDHYICRRDDGRRGRGDEEVPRMIESALLAHGISADRVQIVIDEQEAIETALRMAGPGDLVLIFADVLARGWKQITQFRSDSAAPVPASPKTPVPQTIRPAAIELADDSVPPPAEPEPHGERRKSPRHVPAALEAAIGAIPIVRDDRGVFLAREQND
ncbi:MAG TPA: hypothetical protein VE861_06815, partial [Gemmatimonadaceae bacterium]|nr:hypothetical protein [Gemmatimonadaceae bacterium]